MAGGPECWALNRGSSILLQFTSEILPQSSPTSFATSDHDIQPADLLTLAWGSARAPPTFRCPHPDVTACRVRWACPLPPCKLFRRQATSERRRSGDSHSCSMSLQKSTTHLPAGPRWEDPGSPEGTGSSLPALPTCPLGGERRRGLQNSGPATSAPGTAAPPGTGCPVTAADWTLDTGPARERVTRDTVMCPQRDCSSGNSQTLFSQAFRFSSLMRTYLQQLQQRIHDLTQRRNKLEANTSTQAERRQEVRKASQLEKMPCLADYGKKSKFEQETIFPSKMGGHFFLKLRILNARSTVEWPFSPRPSI